MDLVKKGKGGGEGGEARVDDQRSSAESSIEIPPPDPAPQSLACYDVAILGSTLGLIYALKLQSQGCAVALIERGKIKGREQEWNIGTGEFKSLQSQLGVDLKRAVGSEFSDNRVGFGEFECRVKGVLDLGVKPDVMTEILKEEFVRLGGVCLEDTFVEGIVEHNDAAVVRRGGGGDVCKR